LGIIDDFRNLHAFLEFKTYGDSKLEILGVSVTSGPRRSQTSTDSITLFINFQQQYETKTRQQAVEYLRFLLGNAPPPAAKAVKEFGKELLDAIS
jgi:hypothetical protein